MIWIPNTPDRLVDALNFGISFSQLLAAGLSQKIELILNIIDIEISNTNSFFPAVNIFTFEHWVSRFLYNFEFYFWIGACVVFEPQLQEVSEAIRAPTSFIILKNYSFTVKHKSTDTILYDGHAMDGLDRHSWNNAKDKQRVSSLKAMV